MVSTSLTDLLDRTPYDITVTPLLDDGTGNGSQVLQICSSGGGKGHRRWAWWVLLLIFLVPSDPGNITIDSIQAEDTSVLVRWKVASQDACGGVTVNYTVFYRTHNGRQFSKAKRID